MTEADKRESNHESPAKSGPDWTDPTVAVGNAPPMPGWPLAIALLAWAGGIVFLLVMMTERLG